MLKELETREELKNFLAGEGIDVSEDPAISEAKHKYIEPSQLYLLRNTVGVETLDYLYGRDIINKTKYFRILLYEWFLVIKKGGYLVLDFEDNEILNELRLKKEVDTLQLYNDRHRLVQESHNGTRRRVIIQKTSSIKRDENEINQWTFGIVTNGKRKDLIEKAINSIRSQNFPLYEIIVCGTYDGELGEDIRYIHFAERDDKGWITKKKNLICENAKYENIVVIHDRIYFGKDWFKGMKEWGNYFDVLSCPVVVSLRDRAVSLNWESVGNNFKLEHDRRLVHSNGLLDPSDWDENAIIPGPLIVLKKHLWAQEKWNENLFWGDAEDIEYSFRQHRGGIVLRFNPYAAAHAAQISGVVLNAYYEKDSQKLGKFHGPGLVTTLPLKVLDLIGFRRNQKVIQWGVRKLKKLQNAASWKDTR